MTTKGVRWTVDADGWQVRVRKDGGTDYRILMRDTGTPRFSGAAKRYAEVWLHPDGSVIGKSQYDYARNFATVDEAKKFVGPQ